MNALQLQATQLREVRQNMSVLSFLKLMCDCDVGYAMQVGDAQRTWVEWVQC